MGGRGQVATSVQFTLAQVLGMVLSTQRQRGLVSTCIRSLYSGAGKAYGEACSGGITKPVSSASGCHVNRISAIHGGEMASDLRAPLPRSVLKKRPPFEEVYEKVEPARRLARHLRQERG